VQDGEDKANRHRNDEEHCATDEHQHLPRWALILRTRGCDGAITTDAVANLLASLLLGRTLVCLGFRYRDTRARVSEVKREAYGFG
jgi:hypothetical protein